MLTLSDQKGTLTPLVIAIIAIVLLGGIFLVSKNATNPQKTPQAQEQKRNTATSESSSSVEWETYKDKERGYSLKHPKGWIVENLPSENSRLIRVMDPDKSAFVLIEGIIGPSLEKEGELEKVIDLLEERLKKSTNIKTSTLTRLNEDDTSGYLALGQETYDEKTVEFEERFIVWKDGKGLRLHAGFAPNTKEINQPIASEIMSSFKTD